MDSHNDLANYAEMLKPFATAEEAAAAVNKFIDLVAAARKECHIADVEIITVVGVADNQQTMSSLHLGNSALSAPMLMQVLESHVQAQQKELDNLKLEFGKPLPKNPSGKRARNG